MTKLTKVASKVWVRPFDVVRIYETDDARDCGGHLYVVLTDGKGSGNIYHTSDWPMAKVERALGLRKWPNLREHLAQWHWALVHVWGQLRSGAGA